MVAQSIAVLISRKWIYKIADHGDGRSVTLNLTAEGIKALRSIEERAAKRLRAATSSMSRAAFHLGLRALRSYVEEPLLTAEEITFDSISSSANAAKRSEVRGFLIRSLVSDGREAECPESLVSKGHVTFVARSGKDLLCACQVSMRGKAEIELAGWNVAHCTWDHLIILLRSVHDTLKKGASGNRLSIGIPYFDERISL